MKLATRYNRVTIIVTLLVLIIGAIVYFFAINRIASALLDDHLSEEVAEVTEYVHLHSQFPTPTDMDDDRTSFERLKGKPIPTRFFDTVYVAPKLKTEHEGRGVEGTLTFKGAHYRFVIIISKESTQYLLQTIATITIVLMLGLFIVLFIVNRYLLSDLWKPFYVVLDHLKAFNVSEQNTFTPVKTKVDEFNELDKAVELMTQRLSGEYQNLKLFTENASHEMLTPLSVITSKLDTLIQDERLVSEQYEQIQDIYSAANKLSRLNQTLLLLVKIENDLVPEAELVNFNYLVNEKYRQFQDMFSERELTVDTEISNKQLKASTYLLDILLNNLFSNTIRHNIKGGHIQIKLNKDELVFCNTGAANPLDGDAIFNRFEKSKNSDGTGLGLTLVKNICNLYGWRLIYEFNNGLHYFIISF
ncbi:sensor histidine kinase [Mucilaginibacter sp.]|uniref:sensor histidine kinase n=1 Tax=Mucilaginibacter sp. TaxID=1882438 RepID=UPI000CC8593D|nr:HAMP domain-containing sensor histidine kinase [Mucilaginibacter sp.]PLW90901.1 MAG: two-component sensor histidine kinase [Mucilaginibacter sp.]PMP66500.1 MAG: two-component sensor histidine kinase [Mucilaginibacter sp.]HEK20505.1 HAMP domain-containing histidine kinase [Bacteroidota bacterium]